MKVRRFAALRPLAKSLLCALFFIAPSLLVSGAQTGIQNPAVVSSAPAPANPQHSPRPVRLPLAGKVIVLDPGHGGTDTGAVRNGVEEKNLTLGIALKLKTKLTSLGAKVIMTRSTDRDLSLQDVVDETVAAHPNIFVSVHINAVANNTSEDGIETYYYTPQSHRLASLVFISLVGELGVPGNWVHERNLYVVDHTQIPSVLAEVGYISNPTKRHKLVQPAYQDSIARALADAIVKYFQR